MEGAFVKGSLLVGVLIVLAIEVHFFIISRFLDKEYSRKQTLVMLVVLALVILLFIKLQFLLALLCLPVTALVIRATENRRNEADDRAAKDAELQKALHTVQHEPENAMAYIAAADVHARWKNWEEAVSFYRQAQERFYFPAIEEKLKLATRELRIQNGERWICPACGRENITGEHRCTECGSSRDSLVNIIAGIKAHKAEFRKGFHTWILISLGIPVVIGLVFWLVNVLPEGPSYFVAICVSIGLMYLIARVFIKWYN